MSANVYILSLIILSAIDVLATQPVSRTLSNLLPAPVVCGEESGTDDIISASSAFSRIDAFSWMTLIEYAKPNNSRGFHCGGVFISERYVLTAAHCVTGKILNQRRWEVSSVRLGEWDINSDEDCNGYECADLPINVDVEEVIVHENYNPNNSHVQENDIALLRLSRAVAFTDFIKPICLPTTEYLKNLHYEGIHLQVAGCGNTEHGSFSNFKLNAHLSGVSIQKCNTVYSRYGVSLGSGQSCVSEIEFRDSCRGSCGNKFYSRGFRIGKFVTVIRTISLWFGKNSSNLY